MISNNRRDEEAFWVGLILGGLIGAGVVFLLGGEEKEKVKRQLGRKGKSFLDNLERVMTVGGEKIGERFQKTEEEIGKPHQEMTLETESSRLPLRRFFTRKGKALS